MYLSILDWFIIALYLITSASIAIAYSRRASDSTSSFFLSGRNLPWWIAGTTMVATTFAADTPLAITELVAKNGIAGNWLWWNMLFGGMFTVFFFARLWRRAGILTDVEFVELRYSGKSAAFLRGFRAIYLGVLMNVVIIGWVNLAMVKILTVMFPELTIFGLQSVSFLGFTFSAQLIVVGLLLFLVAIFASLSGLWGVAITDVFQFVIAMTGTIILAVKAVNLPEIGGLAGLTSKLPESVFQFTPQVGSRVEQIGGTLSLTLSAFIAYIGVQWWASWYPGADPGGGGYIAQRMMSAKDEKHALLATLWFTVAHYAIRPWPWIIVALVSLVLYPDLEPARQGEGFVMVMRDHLPSGLLGLLLAAFLAAYMSTISTQLNWGASYLINDFYRRFIRPDADERQSVAASRYVTFAIMLLSLLVTSKLDRISDAWVFILEASAGIGVVLMLRWFWWRINAWSEIAALIIPLAIYPIVKHNLAFPHSMFAIVVISTIGWLSITFATSPTDRATLHKFYKRVHPGGRLWAPIAAELPDVQGDSGYLRLIIDWVAGCTMVMSALFGVGHLLVGDSSTGVLFLMLSASSAGLIFWHISRFGWAKVAE